MKKHEREILKNKRYFEKGIAQAESLLVNGHAADAAALAAKMTYFSLGSTTGYYTYNKLERLLHHLGQQLPTLVLPEKSSSLEQLKILHIATELYSVGGHTRLLLNWVKRDSANNHRILLSNQQAEFPTELFLRMGVSTDIVVELSKSSTIMDRARAIREIAVNFDLLVLHIHQNEIAAIIALSHENIPPVAFMNHADHCFWTGSSITDVLVEIRESTITLDKERRHVKNCILMPIPLDNIQVTSDKEKAAAREILGIKSGQVMLLSIGSAYKYQPNDNYNFFEDAFYVLDNCPEAILYIVGINAGDELAKKFKHKRIAYCGVQTEQLNLYRSAADIFVSSYPFPSFTAMLETALMRKPVHLMIKPRNLVRVFGGKEEGILAYPDNKEIWRKELIHLITDKEVRKQIELAQFNYLWQGYGPGAWERSLAKIYSALLSKKHQINIGNEERHYLGEDEYELFMTVKPNSLTHLKGTGRLRIWKRIQHILEIKNLPQSIAVERRRLVSYMFGHFTN